MSPLPKWWMNLGPKNPIQWICREWVENWVLMSWTTNKVDSDYKKKKIDWFKLKEIVLGAVRGDQFLYISLKFDYKYNSWLLQYFSLCFSIPILRVSLLFYTIFPFHLHLPRANQIVGVDPCLISIFLKSLGSSCKAESYCSGITSSSMWPES